MEQENKEYITKLLPNPPEWLTDYIEKHKNESVKLPTEPDKFVDVNDMLSEIKKKINEK